MGWGDEIVAAGQAQSIHERTGKRVQIVDQQRRPRWHPIWEGNPAIVRPNEIGIGDEVVELQSGPNCRPYIVYPFTMDSGWTFNQAFRCRDHVAKLYLTPGELAKGEALRDRVGPYVLIEPFTKHDNFRWPLERWQQLVEACPDVTFVQHTHSDSPRLSGVTHEPATFREACGLIASADAYVRSESGLCHAAAALGRPQVTLFGGCMDAEVMGGYPGQIVIVDETEGSPCGSWRPCAHCAAAMQRITVDMVKAALMAALQRKGSDGAGDVRSGSVAPKTGRRDRGHVAGVRRRRRSAAEDGAGDGAGDRAPEAACGVDG